MIVKVGVAGMGVADGAAVDVRVGACLVAVGSMVAGGWTLTFPDVQLINITASRIYARVILAARIFSMVVGIDSP